MTYNEDDDIQSAVIYDCVSTTEQFFGHESRRFSAQSKLGEDSLVILNKSALCLHAQETYLTLTLAS